MLRQQAYFELREEREERLAYTPRTELPTHKQIRYPLVDPQELLLEARAYLHLLYQERDIPSRYQERFIEVAETIIRTGTYWQTSDELAYGARIAWRNSTRCIGRLHWKSLTVRDLRHLSTMPPHVSTR